MWRRASWKRAIDMRVGIRLSIYYACDNSSTVWTSEAQICATHRIKMYSVRAGHMTAFFYEEPVRSALVKSDSPIAPDRDHQDGFYVRRLKRALRQLSNTTKGHGNRASWPTLELEFCYRAYYASVRRFHSPQVRHFCLSDQNIVENVYLRFFIFEIRL